MMLEFDQFRLRKFKQKEGQRVSHSQYWAIGGTRPGWHCWLGDAHCRDSHCGNCEELEEVTPKSLLE